MEVMDHLFSVEEAINTRPVKNWHWRMDVMKHGLEVNGMLKEYL